MRQVNVWYMMNLYEPCILRYSHEHPAHILSRLLRLVSNNLTTCVRLFDTFPSGAHDQAGTPGERREDW